MALVDFNGVALRYGMLNDKVEPRPTALNPVIGLRMETQFGGPLGKSGSVFGADLGLSIDDQWTFAVGIGLGASNEPSQLALDPLDFTLGLRQMIVGHVPQGSALYSGSADCDPRVSACPVTVRNPETPLDDKRF